MEKSIKITAIIGASAIIIALLIFLSISYLVSSNDNTISVTGNAQIKAIPDLLTIYFNTETKGDTSAEATSANAKIVEDLTTNIIALGFERKDIQTENFNVYPNYIWVNGDSKQNGYKATHSVKIEMSPQQTDKIGEVIDAGVNAGAGISYINFELSQIKQNEYKTQAIKLAAQDASIKAKSVAEGLDKKLGSLVSVNINDFAYYPWRVFEASGSSDVVTAKQTATNIQPSEKEISAQVSAVYKIR